MKYELDFNLVSDTPFPDNIEEMFSDIVDFLEIHQDILHEESTINLFIDFCDDKNYPMSLAQQIAFKVMVAVSDQATVDAMFELKDNYTVH